MDRRRIVSALVLVALMLSMVGCSAPTNPEPEAPAADPAALEGVEWVLTGTSVADVDSKVVGITAAFKDGQISGFSGVNTYNGPYTAGEDGSFDAGPLASTLIAGPEPAASTEVAFLKLLDTADKFAVAEGKLTLTIPSGDTLEFEAVEPVTLPGTSWLIKGYNNGKEAVVGVEQESELTLVFGSDGTVSGSAGVNQFNGPFTVDGDTIKIGPLATTKMAGPDNLMEQEAAYLKALEAGVVWDVARDVLTTRDAEGAMQINAIPK